MKLHYLGPTGSYSHIAAEFWNSTQGSKLDLSSNINFIDIFSAVKNEDSFGILPIENFITSNIHENIDRIFSKEFSIVGEMLLHINLHLLSHKNASLEKITQVISHPKALEQVQDAISQNHWEALAASSTADAAKKVSESQTLSWAAIGSKALIKHYSHLKILKADIGDVKNNYTRFLIIRNHAVNESKPTDNKATYIFTVPHEPGALVRVLSPLGESGVNVTKIESRPIPSMPGSYSFWIDVMSNEADGLQKAEVIMSQYCESYTVLGSYKNAEIYES